MQSDRSHRSSFQVTAILGLAVFLLFLEVGLASAASRPAVRGTGGAVASDEQQATEAGLAVLAAGGNAVDGAVATALALAVVEPEAGNLGGGGFAVIKIGDEVAFLDFREEAPAAAFRDMYLDASGEPNAEASLIGPLAAGVPGSPAGLHALHAEHGQLPWAKVVEPARLLAANGFRVSSRLVAGLEEKRETLSRFPETAEVWLPGGEVPAAGSVMRLPDLASTLAGYAERGPEAITTGRVAAAVEKVSKRHGGILTAADMAGYEPVWRQPLRFESMGWQVASANLPSSGGILMASTFWQLEKLGWASSPRFGADRAHLLAEAWRRAYADRYLLGDPETTAANAADLLAPEWLESRVKTVDPRWATNSSKVQLWTDVEGTGAGPAESADTTHLSVVDGEGNLVALTFTINDLFGCGLYVPEAGFFLNNEMDDFAAAPGKPNFYGLVQGEANAVAPGKRMLSSQTPTIVWREGEAIALGGRGGSRIPTSTMQVLLAMWVDGDGLQAALDRPRIHHQWRPDALHYEADALSPETRAKLVERGHILIEIESLAQVQAVRWYVEDGRAWVEAGAEPRGGGGWGGAVEPLP